MPMSEIRIKQVRSGIGTIPKHRATLKALGLRRINQVVTKQDTAQIRGMLKRVSHLVEIVG
jgi:large subunit ribosomal protein L30